MYDTPAPRIIVAPATWRRTVRGPIFRQAPFSLVSTFFLSCALLGGGVLVLQLVLSVVGFDHADGHDLHGGEAASEGLNLLGIRALSAGVAFFGLAGLAARPLGAFLATLAGLTAGALAALGVAAVMRSFRRLESDRTLSIVHALGATGTVYLTIPGARAGVGKVHVTVQERLVEWPAVTHDESLQTGDPILVVDIERDDTLVVVRNPILLNEVSNVVA